MNRLTKTYRDKTYKIFGVADDLPCGENSYDFKNLLIQKLGEYEDLEEQGLLIKLPCKIGASVYEICTDAGWHRVDDLIKYHIEKVKFNFEHIDEIGKTVFLTREEAEKALKEKEEI